MSQREMRKQTERKYQKCPEVKNKKVEIKREQEYKKNKIMANIFNKVIKYYFFDMYLILYYYILFDINYINIKYQYSFRGYKRKH